MAERSGLTSKQSPLAPGYCGYSARPCAVPDSAWASGRLDRDALLMMDRAVAVSVGWIKCLLD